MKIEVTHDYNFQCGTGLARYSPRVARYSLGGDQSYFFLLVEFCCVVSCVQFVGLLILVGIVQGFQNSNASELQRVFGNYSVFFSNDKVYTCNFKHVSRLSNLKNSITNSIFFLSGGQVLHLFVKIINLLLGYYQLANTGWDQGFSSAKFSSLGNKKKRGCNVFWK